MAGWALFVLVQSPIAVFSLFGKDHSSVLGWILPTGAPLTPIMPLVSALGSLVFMNSRNPRQYEYPSMFVAEYHRLSYFDYFVYLTIWTGKLLRRGGGDLELSDQTQQNPAGLDNPGTKSGQGCS